MKIFIKKSIILFYLALFVFTKNVNAQENFSNFDEWVKFYKNYAMDNGVSKQTVEIVFKNVIFLDQVIKYDRKQPEFFEDTITYVNKRATKSRAKKAKKLLKENLSLFNEIEKKFNVEKEILLALWGIETNFGKHVGKMDIFSSIATLSYDKRRRNFFSSQLLTLLKLVDRKLIDPVSYKGSWAGAFGNFQFMPSTIANYAIDYDNNEKIDLKNSLEDSLASAANYINKIGWKKGQPCFTQVILKKKIKKNLINLSAKKISNKLKISKWKKNGVVKYDGSELKTNYYAGLIMPDGKEGSPTFLVYDNYEKILKWNRSLRFGVSVCTLSEMIKV